MQNVNKQQTQSYGDYANKWVFGFNPSAELWNGRLAMAGFAIALGVELTTGEGVLHFLGLI